MKQLTCILFACFCLMHTAPAQTNSTFTRKEVVYGYKDGMALIMVVVSPKEKNNGKAIIQVVSSGYFSGYDQLATIDLNQNSYLDRGYTVFAVMHSSQPKYTIPEIIPDISRAVRFIRYHAKDYNIDPNHIGITGGSSGANLAMLAATMDENLALTNKDPVERVSSRVQAVACFFGATDYLNYGNSTQLNEATLAKFNVAAPFDFVRWDTVTKTYAKVIDSADRMRVMKQLSPLYHVTSDDPPIMIAHGDADQLVPLQQSQWMIAKLKEANIPCQLRIKKGGGHGWQGMEEDRRAFADWFDKYLK